MPKDSSQLKLSILILSIPSRLEKYTKLQDKLLAQIGDREDVEVLCMIDNKSFHIYEKRNVLLQAARGSHLAWLDDDDDVADNYIEKLTAVIEEDPSWDVISFNQDTYLDGKHARIYCEMGNPHDPVIMDVNGNYKDTLRPPYHWCVWRTELAQSESFRSAYSQTGQSCEDIDWLVRLYPKVLRSYKLDDFLHIYRWSSEGTESIVK
jgi:hypothetical protein